MMPQCIWLDEVVTPIELDETGRWVTVRLVSTGVYHIACIDELQGFDRRTIPQVV